MARTDSSLKSSFRRIGVRTPCFLGLVLSSPTSPPRPAVVYWEPGVWPGRVARLLAHYPLSAYHPWTSRGEMGALGREPTPPPGWRPAQLQESTCRVDPGGGDLGGA